MIDTYNLKMQQQQAINHKTNLFTALDHARYTINYDHARYTIATSIAKLPMQQVCLVKLTELWFQDVPESVSMLLAADCISIN